VGKPVEKEISIRRVVKRVRRTTMESIKKAIEEDFNTAFEAFKNDSFERMNIYANRMMSNALFGDDPKIFLPGFFLKDVSFTYGLLKTRKSATAFSTAKSHGLVFIETLRKLLPSLDEKELWKEFHGFNDKIRKFEMEDFEERSYSDNIDFTKQSYKWLLSYLDSNKKSLLDPRNFLLKGIINEMVRIFNMHSGTVEEIVVIHLLEALDRNYDYICRLEKPGLRLINEEKVKTDIFPFLDEIIKVYGQGDIAQVDKILWMLVKSWRGLFIKYMELSTPGFALQKGIELPEELKKKLGEGITRALEKEL
jgi:hypothetical protein